VIDDLLPPDQFPIAWKHFQNEKYANPHVNGWQKVWRLTDNDCLGSQDYPLTKKPFNNYMDGVSSYMLEANRHVSDIGGEEGKDWSEAIFRSYIYPRGSKLSWHNDGGDYHAALTYYVHPYWGSTWGGELMASSTPDLDSYNHEHKGNPHLDHRWEDAFIGELGFGHRLVIMSAGVFHAINRVDDDAGDNARCSVVSFLIKS
jgi:hypothetical protein